MSHFSIVKFFFSPFFITVVFGGSHYLQPTHKEWVVIDPPLRGGVSAYIWKFSVHIYPLSFTYLFSHFFLQSKYILYNQCNVIYFVAQIVLTLAIGSSCVPSTYLLSLSLTVTLFCLFPVFPHTTKSLAPQDHLNSSCIFSDSVPASTLLWDLNVKSNFSQEFNNLWSHFNLHYSSV